MDKEFLTEKLTTYMPMGEDEATAREQMIDFITREENCFKRECEEGHFTGSAWIVDPSWSKVLLLHHAGLGRWLQPGGHCDGSMDALGTAMREAQEETGLQSIRPVSEEIFDLDVHIIPARNGEPTHKHFDIRYLFEADSNEPLTLEEGKAYGLEWKGIEELAALGLDESVARMAEKIHWLKHNSMLFNAA